MAKILSKREALNYLGIRHNAFENYFKSAKEFPALERKNGKGRIYFDEDVLRQWKQNLDWRTVELDKNDYVLCLDFALAQHFRNYVLSDFGTGRQREFGQKITNWVKGQLGEVAVKKFLKKEFNIDVELDFHIRDEIVAQDIVSVKENGRSRSPKIGVGIKSSKPKSAFLVIGENEMKIDGRKSEIYIYCRPDIPDDHLLRITKDTILKLVEAQPHFDKYKDLISDFANIPCEIAGWCHISELREVKNIPGQEFEGVRFVIESGRLKKTEKDWQEIVKML